MNREKTFHAVMAEAAKFRARDFVLAGFRGFKPNINGHARHHVLLEPELRKKKTVDDGRLVFFGNGRERDANRPPDWNVQLIDVAKVIVRVEFFVRAGILNVPGKLFGLDADLHTVRVRGHTRFDFRPNILAHESKREENKSWDRGPNDFGADMAVRVMRLSLRALAVADQKKKERELHAHKNNSGDDEDNVKQMVNVAGKRGNAFRQPPLQRW